MAWRGGGLVLLEFDESEGFGDAELWKLDMIY